MKLHIKKFNELTLKQLYQILKLRFDTFVLEQKSFYPEYDYKDFGAIHIFFEEKKEVIAYVRMRKDEGGKVHLARVVVHKACRNKGLGRKIVQSGIDYTKSRWKKAIIESSVQVHLKHFYGSFGFRTTSKVYREGGVPHITMVLNL